MVPQLKHIPVKEVTFDKFALKAFIAKMTYDELLSDMLNKEVPDATR